MNDQRKNQLIYFLIIGIMAVICVILIALK